MIAPAVIYIAALIGMPFFLALFYSFSNITVGTEELHFVGLKNFRAILDTPGFQVALKNSFIFTFVSQAIVLILAKILALSLVRDFRGKWVVRLLIILPWVAPISLGAIGWLWMLDSIYSIVNWGLRAVGIFGPSTWPIWLGLPKLAMASVIAVHVWRLLPLATIILLAGLTSIPRDIQEAAAADGARFWRQLFEITIPMVLPIMGVAVLFGIVFTFTDMIVIFVLTRGGPFDSTHVLASLAFFTGIEGGDLAEGAAIALFLFPLLVAVAFLMLRLARRSEVT
ncbi:MAG: sugar ABC transporter permease [Candidatus Tectomicrobia bacterium]|nr:sugar ABC transporter permease [Candidatus Tectomicrobia bacterium]